MKTKVRVEKDGAYVLLPPNLADGMGNAEVEVFPLRDGVFLVCAGKIIDQAAMKVEKEAVKKPSGLSLSDEELAVAKKLFSIKFENRTPPQLDKVLSPAEKKAVAKLCERKLVTVFSGGKYAKGVYNINEPLYVHMRSISAEGRGRPQMQGTETGHKAVAVVGMPAIDAAGKNTLLHLAKYGYMVLEGEYEAKALMPSLEESIRSGQVKGVRGFDKKYYVLRRQFLLANEKKLLSLLDGGELTAGEAAAKLGMGEDAARALLVVLAEEGEVLEKNARRGVWARA